MKNFHCRWLMSTVTHPFDHYKAMQKRFQVWDEITGMDRAA